MKVKVQHKVTRTVAGRQYASFYVVIPSAYAELLKIRKGDVLECIFQEVEVNGRRVKAVIYFKA